MSWLNEIEKIEKRSFWFGLLDLILFVSPGLVFIFLFKREMFFGTEFIKLITLSISLVVPLVIINTILILISFLASTEDETMEQDLFISVSLSLIMTSLIFYAISILRYFVGFSLKIGLLLLGGSELILAILFIILLPKKSINSSGKKESEDSK